MKCINPRKEDPELQLLDTRNHPDKHPVLLEELLCAEGSDSPASPLQ